MRLASQFLEAADSVAESAPGFSKVELFLYGHCLELAFKATLICAGTTEERLKRLGHKLPRTLRAARRQRSPVQAQLSAGQHQLVGWLSHYYGMKDFEYVATGVRLYPGAQLLSGMCHDVIDDLKPRIDRFIRGWLRQRRTG
jgi:hypothetical protein